MPETSLWRALSALSRLSPAAMALGTSEVGQATEDGCAEYAIQYILLSTALVQYKVLLHGWSRQANPACPALALHLQDDCTKIFLLSIVGRLDTWDPFSVCRNVCAEVMLPQHETLLSVRRR